MTPHSLFPIQQPLRSHQEVQQAIHILKTVYIEHVKRGKPLILHIDEPHVPYSAAQRSKAHAIYGDIQKATGNDLKTIKEWSLDEHQAGWFMNVLEVDHDGNVKSVPRRFSDLDKDQVTYLIDRLQQHCAENDIPTKE